MLQDVRIPEISENVESGEVAKVLVSVGDSVQQDQGLLELETEKAVVELPSPAAGVVKEILVGDGDTVSVGDLVIKLETDGKPAEPDEQAAPAEKPAAEPEPEPAVEEEEPAPASEPEQPEPPPEREKPAPPARPRKPQISAEPAPAGPAVRRLARELGVEIERVRASGPHGRILEDDVKQYVKSRVSAPAAPSAGELPDLSKWGEIERERMSKVRKITAATMANAWATVPQVTQFEKADITHFERFRHTYAKRFERAGAKLTPTAILLKIVAEGLKKFPKFNASVDMRAQEIVYRRYINVSVAVDTDRGLLVPVVRDVDTKDLIQLAKELGDISERARNRKLAPEEMEGGTFTISNQGSIGGEWFTPIVYPPQVAILGVSRSLTEAKWIDGEWAPRTMLPLTLSYDHRLIDGADASRFLAWLCAALAHPFAMFI
ncbi:MAG: Dihydrolipoyllysine-residue acetyltransferase component of pyruvate dehydrogenase complex [Calditrichaeota bacterium]|nr:Dihydrolipoyllysine-residue acetyltransferase component of pyruvate dehydrogenase complex [Calditrichota bacterium]